MEQGSCFSAMQQQVGPMIDESAQHLRRDLGTTEAVLREETNRLLMEHASGFSAMLEQKVVPMIETAEATLREEMSRKVQQLREKTRGKK
jgi:hypothetical protein